MTESITVDATERAFVRDPFNLSDATYVAAHAWTDLVADWPEAGILVTHESDHFAMIHALAEGAANYAAALEHVGRSLQDMVVAFQQDGLL